MRKNIELTEEQMKELVQKFYDYFDTGFKFEQFLKIYLEKIGLDEVSVTQKTRDGGIDLKAVKNGLFSESDVDSVQYYVQAKRNKINTSIAPSKVRELKGKIPFGHKGIFITTAKFSTASQEEALNDPTKPVILVDGKTLVESCIDNEIGFVFLPSFSKDAMDVLMSDGAVSEQIPTSNEPASRVVVEKQITANDIRARILRVPRAILDVIGTETNSIKVVFDLLPEKELALDKTRTYLAGVTDLYKQKKLLSNDGSYNPQKAIWNYYEDRVEITLKG